MYFLCTRFPNSILKKHKKIKNNMGKKKQKIKRRKLAYAGAGVLRSTLWRKVFWEWFLSCISWGWAENEPPSWPHCSEQQSSSVSRHSETTSGIRWREGELPCNSQQWSQHVRPSAPSNLHPVQSAYTMGIWTDLKIKYKKYPPSKDTFKPEHAALASPSGRDEERAENRRPMAGDHISPSQLLPTGSQNKRQGNRVSRAVADVLSSSMKTTFCSWKLKPEAKWPLDVTKPQLGHEQTCETKLAELLYTYYSYLLQSVHHKFLYFSYTTRVGSHSCLLQTVEHRH